MDGRKSWIEIGRRGGVESILVRNVGKPLADQVTYA